MRPDHHRAHAWAMDEGTPFARFYWCWGLGQRYKRYGGEIRHVVDVDILGALVTEEGAD